MRNIVLVAGVSCSGKTTLARKLASHLDAAYISIDDYYRPFDSLSLEDRKKINFDAPAAIEHELLVQHLADLKLGRTVHKPVYDAPAFARLPGHEPVYSANLVVIEGLFSLYWPELREHANLKIFVDTHPAECLQRRLHRDVNLYGRSEQESRRRYESQVQPNQERYVLPTKAHADLVVSGQQPIEHGLASVENHLRTPIVL